MQKQRGITQRSLPLRGVNPFDIAARDERAAPTALEALACDTAALARQAALWHLGRGERRREAALPLDRDLSAQGPRPNGRAR